MLDGCGDRLHRHRREQAVPRRPGGDHPIDLYEPRYTRPEAAFLARLPVKQVINWMGRGHCDMIGTKDPWTKRWRFSVLDVLRLSVMFDFCCRTVLLLPAEAAGVAEIVVEAAMASTDPTMKPAYRPNVNVVVSWDARGEMIVNAFNIRTPAYYPPRRDEHPDAYVPLRHSHMVIPATAMLIDVVLRTQHLPLLQAELEQADGDD